MEQGAGRFNPRARTCDWQSAYHAGAKARTEKPEVVAVEIEMRRSVWLTAQDSADNSCLRPSIIPKSDHRIYFCRLSRRRI